MSLQLPAHCSALLSSKSHSGLTFAEIASRLNKPEVWTTALFFGQARCDEPTAKAIVSTMGIPPVYEFHWGDHPEVRTMSDEMVVSGLMGRGSGSMGVDGMVVRGATWESPPKVSLTWMVGCGLSSRTR